MNFYDNERQNISTTANFIEHDIVNVSKLSSIREQSQLQSRYPLQERRARPSVPLNTRQNLTSSIKRAYSFVDKNRSSQVIDERIRLIFI